MSPDSNYGILCKQPPTAMILHLWQDALFFPKAHCGRWLCAFMRVEEYVHSTP